MAIQSASHRTALCGRTVLAVAFVVGLLLPAAPCLGDRIILKNGRSFDGRLIRSDDREVVFEIHKYGSKVSRTFQKDQVERVITGETEPIAKPASEPPKKKPVPEEDTSKSPRYYVIPIKGAIGREVTDEVFEKCLNLARAAKPEVVVLEVDSPGGSVQELSDMLDTLKDFRNMRIVAYFHQASSAAAFLSMACKEIVAGPTGTIGGAVVYQMTPWGTPTNINEKMESILRAKFRSEALNAGHDALLIEGMMRTDLELRLVEKDGKPTVVRGGRAGKVLKAKGKILTLDASQAVACGLALGQATKVEECNKLLDIAQWRRLPNTAGAMFKTWTKRLDGIKKQFDKVMKEAEDYYNQAGLSHPMRGNYMVDDLGRMTPASRKLWRQRSDRCAALLRKSELLLGQAAELAKRYPELGFSDEGIDALRRRIAALRAEIQAGRSRMGL